MATLRDIAKACNVSYSTVSRSFNPDSTVHPELRARVLAYAQSINFTPNALAQGLKKQRTGLIGMILQLNARMYFEYNLCLLRCYERKLKQAGFQVVTCFAENIEEERKALQQLIGLHVEAILIQPFGPYNVDVMESARNSVFFLQIGGHFEGNGFDAIIPNDSFSTLAAMDHLLKKGHRKILLVAPPEDHRVIEFRTSLENYGVTFCPESIFTTWTSEHDIIDKIKEFQPTAIFGTSHAAPVAYTALLTMGLRIPDDISFIAYDDLQWTRIAKITSMGQRWENMGTAMIELLTKNLTAFQKTGQFLTADTGISIPLDIIDRNSVRQL